MPSTPDVNFTKDYVLYNRYKNVCLRDGASVESIDCTPQMEQPFFFISLYITGFCANAALLVVFPCIISTRTTKVTSPKNS